jgi:cephalosporin hydroxylase
LVLPASKYQKTAKQEESIDAPSLGMKQKKIGEAAAEFSRMSKNHDIREYQSQQIEIVIALGVRHGGSRAWIVNFRVVLGLGAWF